MPTYIYNAFKSHNEFHELLLYCQSARSGEGRFLTVLSGVSLVRFSPGYPGSVIKG